MCAVAASMVCAGALGAENGPEQESGNPAAFVTDVFSVRAGHRPRVELDGTWEFRRDPDGRGREHGWQLGDERFPATIQIPGVPQAQGLGEENEWQKSYLNESFWVRRTFTMPDMDTHQRAWLRTGGILPAAQIWLNGEYVGYTRSSRTQQRVDVTDFVRPDAENLIAIRVCDWPAVKLEGLWEMGELRRVWTGVYRPVSIEITNDVSIIDVYARPRLTSSSVRAVVTLSEAAQEPMAAAVAVKDGDAQIGRASATIGEGEQAAKVRVKLDRFTPWSPEHPKLYDLEVCLSPAGSTSVLDKVSLRLGMREIKSDGGKLYLNGTPIYIRCFGDDQLYCDTLAPPADPQYHLANLRRARAYGFNAAKSCEETFSQDYVEAADEAGIMIIQEMPFGLSGYVRTTQHELEEPWRQFYGAELDGLIKQSRNNASVLAFSMCSEVPLDVGTQEAFDFFARQCTRRARKLAPHCVLTDNTGWLSTTDTPRGRRTVDFYAVILPTWCKTVLDEPAVESDGLQPILLHEYSWWSYYPDPASRSKYANSAIFPWWLDTLEESAAEKGQLDLVPTYTRNSQWLQALCRKDGLEYARRSKGIEGYILWLITDFGQYTEGVFDDFWNPRLVSAQDMLQSTADTVIVLGQEGDRCLAMGQKAQIPLAVSHYGETQYADATLRWRTSGGPLAEQGALRLPELSQGALTAAGHAEFTPPVAATAYMLELDVELRADGKTVNTNRWSFWAFPEASEDLRGLADKFGQMLPGEVLLRLASASSAPIPDGTRLVVADNVDEALCRYVADGGKCVLLSSGSAIEEPLHSQFRTIPWNRGPGNSGTVVSPHPALAAFPHDQACDLQFCWLIKGAAPLNFGELRAYGVDPIIRAIDWYQANENLAYLMEFRVGDGQVLVTSLPLLRERLEATYLLKCLLEYAHGDSFAPSAEVPESAFLELFGAQ